MDSWVGTKHLVLCPLSRLQCAYRQDVHHVHQGAWQSPSILPHYGPRSGSRYFDLTIPSSGGYPLATTWWRPGQFLWVEPWEPSPIPSMNLCFSSLLVERIKTFVMGTIYGTEEENIDLCLKHLVSLPGSSCPRVFFFCSVLHFSLYWCCSFGSMFGIPI